MRIDKLKRICNKSIHNAGPRYTPGISNDAPNLKIIDLNNAISGLLHDEIFKSEINDHADKINNGYTNLYTQKNYNLKFRTPKGICNNLKQLHDSEPGKGIDYIKKLNLAINKLIINIRKTTNELHDKLSQRRKEIDENIETGEKPNHYDDKVYKNIEQDIDELYKYTILINQASNFINSSACKLSVNNKLLLEGEWGTGKTHYLCDLSKELISKKHPVLFILAKDFIPNPSVISALAKYTNSTKGFVNSVNNLNKTAKKRKTRAVIILDGINESNHKKWSDSISTILDISNKYKNISFILSCRSPYQDIIFSKSEYKQFIRLKHPGFEEIEFNAQSDFFKYYKLPLPSVPLLANEFSRPLALKTICESISDLPEKEKKRNFDGITSGMKGLTFILERFIKARGKIIEDNFGLRRGLLWFFIKGHPRYINDPFSGIAPYMVINNISYLTKIDCLKIIKKITNITDRTIIEDIYIQLITEGIITESYMWRSREDGGRIKYVSMPYQKFSDAIVARYILSNPDYLNVSNINSIKRSFYKNRYLGKLFSLGKHQHSYIDPGIAESIISEFPERVKKTLPKDKRELFYYLPKNAQNLNAYYMPFLDGMIWRNPSTISEQTNAIIRILIQNKPISYSVFDTLLAVATKHSHTYNGQVLYNYLSTCSIQYRDLYWSEYLREAEEHSSAYRLLTWYEHEVPIGLSNVAINNSITLFSLYLTTTDNLLRNRATKVLVKIGHKYPSNLLTKADEILNFNDSYVVERILAAAYGTCLYNWNNNVRLNKNKIIIEFAKKLVNYIYKSQLNINTCHINIREYSLGIINLAKHIKKGCIRSKFTKRPYIGIPNIFPRVNNIRNSRCEKVKNAIHMDFKNYTIGGLVKDRSNYDMTHIKYKHIKKQIYWRISDLGYDKKLYEDIDQSIGKIDFRRDMSGKGKVERYGKKYSWIAFYEMAGILEAQGKLDSDYDDKITFDRNYYLDIDPTFPEINNLNINISNVFKSRKITPKSWLKNGPLPQYNELLTLKDYDNEWVLLHGFISKKDLKTTRTILSFINGYFIDSNDLEDLGKLFNSSEHPGNNLGDNASYETPILGEISWSDNFAIYQKNKNGSLKIHTHYLFNQHLQKKKKIRLKESWHRINDITYIRNLFGNNNIFNNLADEHLNELIRQANLDLDDDQKIYIPDLLEGLPTDEEIEAGFHFVTHHVKKLGIKAEPAWAQPSGINYAEEMGCTNSTIIPNPIICDKYDINLKNGMPFLYENNGKKASHYEYLSSAYNDTISLGYLRKDILDKYIKEKSKEYIWLNWGERSYSHDIYDMPNKDPIISNIYSNHDHIYKKMSSYK